MAGLRIGRIEILKIPPTLILTGKRNLPRLL